MTSIKLKPREDWLTPATEQAREEAAERVRQAVRELNQSFVDCAKFSLEIDLTINMRQDRNYYPSSTIVINNIKHVPKPIDYTRKKWTPKKK